MAWLLLRVIVHACWLPVRCWPTLMRFDSKNAQDAETPALPPPTQDLHAQGRAWEGPCDDGPRHSCRGRWGGNGGQPSGGRSAAVHGVFCSHPVSHTTSVARGLH
eukprot:783933-Pelagomonas_calceolata.AAC.3